MIKVFPTLNVALPWNTACTDLPIATRAFTWLDKDVRDKVVGHLRGRRGVSWGAAGHSTGGYCAAQLALLDSAQFHAAAVLSGDLNAVQDGTTGDLWGHSRRYRHLNDLLYQARPGRHLAGVVRVVTSRQDFGAAVTSEAPVAEARMPTSVFSVVVDRAGRNLKLVKLALPEELVRLWQHLSPTPTRTRLSA